MLYLLPDISEYQARLNKTWSIAGQSSGESSEVLKCTLSSNCFLIFFFASESIFIKHRKSRFPCELLSWKQYIYLSNLKSNCAACWSKNRRWLQFFFVRLIAQQESEEKNDNNHNYSCINTLQILSCVFVSSRWMVKHGLEEICYFDKI